MFSVFLFLHLLFFQSSVFLQHLITHSLLGFSPPHATTPLQHLLLLVHETRDLHDTVFAEASSSLVCVMRQTGARAGATRVVLYNDEIISQETCSYAFWGRRRRLDGGDMAAATDDDEATLPLKTPAGLGAVAPGWPCDVSDAEAAAKRPRILPLFG